MYPYTVFHIWQDEMQIIHEHVWADTPADAVRVTQQGHRTELVDPLVIAGHHHHLSISEA